MTDPGSSWHGPPASSAPPPASCWTVSATEPAALLSWTPTPSGVGYSSAVRRCLKSSGCLLLHDQSSSFCVLSSSSISFLLSKLLYSKELHQRPYLFRSSVAFFLLLLLLVLCLPRGSSLHGLSQQLSLRVLLPLLSLHFLLLLFFFL